MYDKTVKEHLPENVIQIPIYYSFGIDDIGSCVDYLIDEGHWKKAKTKKGKEGTGIKAKEFDFKGTREKLIQYIGDNNMEKDLRDIVGDVWKEIEDAVKINRKKRYE